MKRNRIAYGSKLPVYFSQAELTDIREHTFAHPDLVAHGLVEGKKLRVDLWLDDIEQIQGYVAAEAAQSGQVVWGR
jgi:hypothetical protein